MEESAGGLADGRSGIGLDSWCRDLHGLPGRWSQATLVLLLTRRSPTERRASLRWLAGPGLTALYFTATLLLTPPFAWAQGSATPASDLTPFARDKAEALLHDHLPCLGCHT